MKQTATRLILILLVATMLLGLCACANQFANFNDGMTEEDYKYDPEAVREWQHDSNERWTKIVLIGGSILMIAAGVFRLIVPQGGWWLAHGWKYRDAEPSKLSLALAQVAGGVAIVVGAIMLIVALAI